MSCMRCIAVGTVSLVAAVVAVGCKAPDWFPNRKVKTEVGPVVKAPADRIDELRKIAKKRPSEKLDAESVVLANSLRDEKDPIVRAETIRTLSGFSTDSASLAMKAAMQDKETAVRIAATESWVKRGGADAVTVLGDALKNDQNMDVRLAAARGLGELKDKAAVPALGVALDSPDPALQHRGMQSLEKITKLDYAGDVNAWREYVKGGLPTPKNEPIVQRFKRWF